MKKLTLGLLGSAAAAALIVPYVHAQVGQGTPVFWNGSRQDVATYVATTSATTATLTLTPASGQSVYVTEIRVTNCQSTAVAPAAPTSVTSTNMQGYTYMVGSGAASAGSCVQDSSDTFGGAPIKAAAPGAVTFVMPTLISNQSVRLSVYWYSAP